MRVGRYINIVALMLDMEVLIDINETALCDGYKLSHKSGDEGVGGAPLRVRVALGVRSDAGDVIVTKWFENEDQLDEFCELNINRFQIAAASGEPVDATEWR
jgi:hypothetical protein